MGDERAGGLGRSLNLAHHELITAFVPKEHRQIRRRRLHRNLVQHSNFAWRSSVRYTRRTMRECRSALIDTRESSGSRVRFAVRTARATGVRNNHGKRGVVCTLMGHATLHGFATCIRWRKGLFLRIFAPF